LYPESANPTFVLPFAVTLPNLQGINMLELGKKFKITTEYFICSNQFWAHKNHIAVLKAVLELKNKGIEILVVFTGQPYDPRNPSHYNQLINFVETNGLVDNVLFLGFINRIEQLVLLKNSIAVIQPSLFEGWSTVIEDAKCLSVLVIASDIPVHREQLIDYHYFFAKESVSDLANIIQRVLKERPKLTIPSYKNNVTEFGTNFLNITSNVCAL
jgi:glycosyltransferase involved in cell wall biosynthesis